jgi:hypothetical protein
MRCVGFVLLVVGGLAAATGRMATAQPGAKPGPRSDRHALLVGCSHYPNLSARFQLEGPANDVVLMRRVLEEHFQFPPDKIVTLSEAEGKKRGKDGYPTRANIEREFRRLAQVARARDQVFILMGGHGSQQPEANPPKGEPEPDGLDEIFLPRDVGKWEDKTGTVANAIIDDELGEWLDAIRAKKASVCIVFDACHSGTMTRGATEVKYRQVEPTGELGIPKKAIKEAEDKAAQREAAKGGPKTRGGGPPPTGGVPVKLGEKGGLVAIAAAQPNEPTLECELPVRSKDGRSHGLLTYTICQVLTKAVETTSKPLTYSELAQRIQLEYVAAGRTSPTPVLEGGDKDREVLGDTEWKGRSSIILRQGPDGLRITAGELDGITAESIYAVRPPAGLGDQLLGHVRVVEVRMNESSVEPCEFEGKPAVKNLPVGGVCTAVFVDYGLQKLRLAVDEKDDNDKSVPADLRKRLQVQCQTLDGEQSMVKPVANSKEADWLVRPLADKRVVLVPASGWSGRSDADKQPAFGPVPADDQLGKWLEKALTHIARAENLKKLAGKADTPRGDLAAKVKVEITANGKPVKWPSPDVTFYNKDKIELRLVNSGRVPVDVTLLYIDSAFGIDALFPDPARNDFNRIAAGESLRIPMTPDVKTTGQEHLVLIALKSSEAAANFSGLAQPSLERYRDVAPKTRGAASPLGQLLEKATYGSGKTRGMKAATEGDAEHTMQLLTWQVRPERRPPQKK